MAGQATGKGSGKSSSSSAAPARGGRSGAASSSSSSKKTNPASGNGAPAPAGGGAAWPALLPLGHHQGKPAIPLMRPVTLVGSRHNAHLHLLSRQISKAHALLISSDGRVYVRDLASRTHVYVNGQEVREAYLEDGDLLKLGSFTFKFQAAVGMKQAPRGDETPAGQFHIDGVDFPIPVDSRVMLVGRRPTCDISLLEESCSTAHAVIFSMNARRYVRDLGSRTGTLVNGQAVRQQEIAFGDTVRIGDTDLNYAASTAEPEAEPAPVDEFEDLIGTAPLVAEAGEAAFMPLDVEPVEPFEAPHPTEAHDIAAAPADLDFDLDSAITDDAPKKPSDTAVLPVLPQPPRKTPADFESIPLVGEETTDQQMLVGDNLLSERLTASGTGAAMHAAAREAQELARLTEEREQAKRARKAPAPPAAPAPADEAFDDLAIAEPVHGAADDVIHDTVNEAPDPSVATPEELAPLAPADDDDAIPVEIDDLVAEEPPLALPNKRPATPPAADDTKSKKRRGWFAFGRNREEAETLAETPSARAPDPTPQPHAETPLDPSPVPAAEDELDLAEFESPLPIDESPFPAEPEEVVAEAPSAEARESAPAAESASADALADLGAIETPAADHAAAPAVEDDLTPLEFEPEPDAEVAEPLDLETPHVEAMAAPAIEVEADPHEEVAELPVEEPAAQEAIDLAPTAEPPASPPVPEASPEPEAIEALPVMDEAPPTEADSVEELTAEAPAETVAEVAAEPEAVEEFVPEAEAPAVEEPIDEAPVAEAPVAEAPAEEAAIEPAPADAAIPVEEIAEEAAEPLAETVTPFVDVVVPAPEPLAESTAEPQVFFGDETIDQIVDDDVSRDPDVLELGTVTAEAPAEPEPTAQATAPLTLVPTAEVIEPTEPTQESALPLDEAVAPIAASVADAPPTVIDLGLSDTSFGREVEALASDSGAIVEEPAIAPAPVAAAAEIEPALPAEPEEDLGVVDPAAEHIEEFSEELSPEPEPFAEAEVEAKGAADDELDAFKLSPVAALAPAVERSAPLAFEQISDEPVPAEVMEEFSVVAEAEPQGPLAEAPLEVEPEPILAPPVIDTQSPLPEFDEAELAGAPSSPVAEAPAPEEPAAEDQSGGFYIPGMPLFGPGGTASDFVAGMPLVLNELAPPPPTFGRVAISFGAEAPPKSKIDERPQYDPRMPAPFDAVNAEAHAQAPIESPTEAADEAELLGEFAPDEADLSAIPDEAPPETADAQSPLQTIDDLPPIEELGVIELEPEAYPTEELPTVEEPVAEPPAALPESEPQSKPRASLFQNKLRLPPPPPRRPKSQPVDEALDTPPEFQTPQAPAAASFTGGGFGGPAQVFGGLTAAGPGNVDVFSQGLSADLSNDPYFGIKSPRPEPVEPPRGKRKGRFDEARNKPKPIDPQVEEMAGNLADELGAPSVADLPPLPPEHDIVAEDEHLPALAPELSPEPLADPKRAAKRPPRRQPAFAGPVATDTFDASSVPDAPPRRRRRNHLVAVLLVVMLALMVLSWAFVFTFMKRQYVFEGSVEYANFNKLPYDARQQLQEDQARLMVSENLRLTASSAFLSSHHTEPLGFLGDKIEFAKNEARLRWTPGGTLVYKFVGTDAASGSPTQAATAHAGDPGRVRAVLESLLAMNGDLSNEARKNAIQAANIRTQLDQKAKELELLKIRRDQLKSLVDQGNVADDEIRALRADRDKAELKYRNAVNAVAAAKAELERLEMQSSNANGVAAPADKPNAAPTEAASADGDHELAELTRTLQQMSTRLDTARNTTGEQAESARKALDESLEKFQRDANVAESLLKDNPELSKLVSTWQQTQETTQKLSGDLLDRTQKNYDQLLADKRFMDEKLAGRRKELWDSDKDIKLLKEDILLSERGFNAAQAQGYDNEAKEIKQRMDKELAQIEGRKMALESDPMLATLSDLAARRQLEIAGAQKQLEADRKQADELAKTMEKNFQQLAPVVAKLPENQQKLAQDMANRMAAVTNARKVFAESLEAKSADANPGLKMLEDNVRTLRERIDDRRKTLAALSTQNMTVEEKQARQGAVEQRRVAYEQAVKAKADVGEEYFKAVDKAEHAERSVADAKRFADDFQSVNDQFLRLKAEVPQLEASLQQKEAQASSIAYPAEPKFAEPVAQADQRWIAGSMSSAAIVLVFSLLIVFVGFRDPRNVRHIGYPLPALPLAASHAGLPPAHDDHRLLTTQEHEAEEATV